jgi:hypothetical protein
MLLQLQDYGTSLWQLRDQAISLPSRLKGRGLLSVQSEAPSTIFFLQCVSPELAHPGLERVPRHVRSWRKLKHRAPRIRERAPRFRAVTRLSRRNDGTGRRPD